MVSADPRAERVGNVWNDVGRLDAKADDVRRVKTRRTSRKRISENPL